MCSASRGMETRRRVPGDVFDKLRAPSNLLLRMDKDSGGTTGSARYGNQAQWLHVFENQAFLLTLMCQK
jgi:hypothetical protein